MNTHEMKYMSKTRQDPVQAEAAARSRDYGAVKSVTSVRVCAPVSAILRISLTRPFSESSHLPNCK